MRSTCACELLGGSLLESSPPAVCCGHARSSRSACPRCLSKALSTQPHGEEVCAACSRCWQRQSAWPCLHAESQWRSTVTTDFDGSYTVGTVNVQDGWKSACPGDIPSLPKGMTRQVVANSWRSRLHSVADRCAFQTHTTQTRQRPPPEYDFQTYSKPSSARWRESGQHGVHRPVLVHFHETDRAPAWAPHGRQPRQWRGRTDVLHWPGRYGGSAPLSPSMTSPSRWRLQVILSRNTHPGCSAHDHVLDQAESWPR